MNSENLIKKIIYKIIYLLVGMIFIIIFFSNSSCLGHPEGAIIVKVFDEITSSPLEGVKVTFLLTTGNITKIEYTTDEGSAVVSWYGPGAMNVNISLSKQGYQDKDIVVEKSSFIVDPGDNANAKVNVYLAPLDL